MKNLARDIDDITPEWLAEVLGHEVRSFTSKKVGTGQTGAAYRLWIDADKGPRTLLAKVATGPVEARQRVATGFACEVGFYSHLQPTLDVRAPECWFSAISDDRMKFTLLLEDLAPRVPGVQAAGVSYERAGGAIRNLAGLHAPRWDDPSLFECEFLTTTRDEKRAAFLAGLTRNASAVFTDRFNDALGAEDIATLRMAADAFEDWTTAANEHFSLLHGDYRLDNLMFGEDCNDVVALDWQTMIIGPPTRDLAYFLGTCLDIGERRKTERDLVNFYHQELLGRGIKDYTLAECFHDYSVGQLHAVLITTVGYAYATGEQTADSDRMFMAMAKRSCAAIRDLHTLDLI